MPDSTRESTSEVLMQAALSCAVPLWIERARQLSPDERMARAAECAKAIEDAGEAILYRIPGKTAAGFNALAEAMGVLAYCPGGITLFGLHFESTR